MQNEYVEALEFMQIDPDLHDWETIISQYWEWQDTVLDSLGVTPWECQLTRTEPLTAYLGSRTGSGIGLWDSYSWDYASEIHILAVSQGRIE